MAYTVRLIPAAKKALAKLPKAVQQRIVLALALLRETPRPPNSKKLSTQRDAYRIRIGDYRILYQIKDRELLVLVIKISHRRAVYRK